MISQVIEILITKAIGLTLLTLIILCIRPLVLRFLNARVSYCLWLMLPLFLVLPPGLAEQSVNSPVMTFFPDAISLLPSIVSESLSLSTAFELNLLIIWIVGALVSFGLYYIRYQKLNASFSVFDYQLPMQQLTHKANFKPHTIEIVNSPMIDVPAVFGLLKPFLILPHGFTELTADRQLMILRHEFYHLARKDHQINFLRVFVKCLFWFNPIIYWADKFIEADQEISCDLGVLKTSLQVEKKSYAEALVESMDGLSQNYLVSQWRYQSLIKERIKMLKNTNTKKWHSWIAALLALTSIWATSVVVAGVKSKTEDSDAIPIVIIQPRYPSKAEMEGVEGWVKIQLNIDREGRPFEVKIVNAMPKGVFEKTSKIAMNKWKFRPKIVSGKAVEQHGMFYTLEFKLAE